MHAASVLVFSALLSFSLTSQAQVYQSTGEDGSVTFSDQSTPDSKEIVVPETNVGDSVDVPPPAPEPEPEVVVEEIPEAPQGELYIREKDGSNKRRRRPTPHSGGGRGR
jgi:hypothetical protein